LEWNIFEETGTFPDRSTRSTYQSKTGIQWPYKNTKYCIKKLSTGERVHIRDHFHHDKRCVSCWHSIEVDDHLFRCTKRKSQQKNIIIKQTYLLRSRVDPILCDIMKEELLTYFKERLLAYTSKEIQLQRQCLAQRTTRVL
jgi:hypothetical protein